MEGSHRLGCNPCPLHRLCHNRDCDRFPGQRFLEMASVDTIHRSLDPPFCKSCRPQVWRGWNGCRQVRSRSFNFKRSCVADVIIHRSLPPLIVALLPGQQRYLEKVKALRENLANEVASLINDFGPKIYDDFDGVRVWDLHLIIYHAHPCHCRLASSGPLLVSHPTAKTLAFSGERAASGQSTLKALD